MTKAKLSVTDASVTELVVTKPLMMESSVTESMVTQPSTTEPLERKVTEPLETKPFEKKVTESLEMEAVVRQQSTTDPLETKVTEPPTTEPFETEAVVTKPLVEQSFETKVTESPTTELFETEAVVTKPLVEQSFETEATNSSKNLLTRGMKVFCPDKVCSLEYRVLSTCVMYEPNPHTDCDIPCNLVNCKVEVRHFVDCPVWSCDPISTTTLAPAPTISPMPHHGSSKDGILYTSVAFNVLFGCLFGFAFYQIRKIRRNLHQPILESESGSADVESGIIRNRNRSSTSTSAPSDLNHFSLDDTEVQPLLSGRSRTQSLVQQNVEQQPRSALIQRLQNFRWSFGTRQWVESQPESNARSISATNSQTSNTGTDFAPSAPSMGNAN